MASTPLHLLSEVAMGRPGTGPNTLQHQQQRQHSHQRHDHQRPQHINPDHSNVIPRNVGMNVTSTLPPNAGATTSTAALPMTDPWGSYVSPSLGVGVLTPQTPQPLPDFQQSHSRTHPLVQPGALGEPQQQLTPQGYLPDMDLQLAFDADGLVALGLDDGFFTFPMDGNTGTF